MIALKYTYKGISGLGEDGASIQPVYRYVDPSHVGFLDLDASSASDPGMSGMLCPMVELHGDDMSFSEYDEPNEWRDNYLPVESKYKEEIDKAKKVRPAVVFEKPENNYTEAMDKYSAGRERIVQEELNINRIRCPLVSIIDPEHILYTCSQAQLDKQLNEERKSIFTVVDDKEN